MLIYCLLYCRAEDLPLNEIDNVYLVDFVGPPGDLLVSCDSFLKFCSSLATPMVVILDHHKTALEMLSSGAPVSGNLTKVINMDRSVATIAYDYFKERLLGGDNNGSKNVALAELQKVRRLFEYIEDVDLWRWRLPNSKSFSSGLKDLNLEFDVTSNPTLFQQVASVQHILHKIGSNM
ncbi:hypothetical protein ACS0TY_034313 [Phlomoides rotata]